MDPLVQIFDDPGNALPSPYTCSNYAVFFPKPFHVVNKLNGQLAAGAA